MADSKIEWTDKTWNPLVGCSIVSPACTNCYAMKQASRVALMSPGLAHYREVTNVVNGKPVWTGKVNLAPEAKLIEPLRWKKPARVFVNSMSDLFHKSVPDEWIDRIFAVMALAHWHTHQVLTKRSARMRAYCSDPQTKRRVGEIICELAIEHEVDAILIAPQVDPALAPPGRRVFLEEWPLRNVWLGVTAERQEEADERIPDLLATPAAVRFVSCEPMLSGLRLDQIQAVDEGEEDTINALTGEQTSNRTGCQVAEMPALDWVICGGESGPGARPMHPDWARGLRDQCAAAGVPFLLKQWGEWAPREEWAPAERVAMVAIDSRGKPVPDDVAPQDIGGHRMARVGKSRAGRLLDGREWNEFPKIVGHE
jgi:protein gp37